MHDKIYPAQYRTLYSDLTGNYSVTDNANSKAVDKRINLILKTADKTILRNIRVNSSQTKSFNNFGI